jgi:hypothetical protein
MALRQAASAVSCAPHSPGEKFTGELATPIDVGDDLDPRNWSPGLTEAERDQRTSSQ